MEEVQGTQLGLVWDSLGPQACLDIIKDLVAVESKMSSVTFSQ